MMATTMDSDSEVHFKEKLEEEGVKAEAASENATIRFDPGHRPRPGCLQEEDWKPG